MGGSTPVMGDTDHRDGWLTPVYTNPTYNHTEYMAAMKLAALSGSSAGMLQNRVWAMLGRVQSVECVYVVEQLHDAAHVLARIKGLEDMEMASRICYMLQFWDAWCSFSCEHAE